VVAAVAKAVDGRVVGAVVEGDWVVGKVCRDCAGVGVRVETTGLCVAAVGGVGVDVMVGNGCCCGCGCGCCGCGCGCCGCGCGCCCC
jgi:hypothetical protein